MIDYEITEEGAQKTLYRISKQGKKVPLCTIVQLENRRLLIVDIKACIPYIVDGEKTTLKKDTKEAIFSISGKIRILKRPHTSQLSYEIMKHNRIAISDGRGGCDTEMLTKGLSEYIATL